MGLKRLIQNIFSNWANLTVSIILTFFVSPILVHSLGNNAYGLWVIIGSITGYFTILDLGINTAVVKYISEYYIKNDLQKVRQVYSASLVIFFAMSLFIVLVGFIISLNIQEFFNLNEFGSKIVLMAFWIVTIELAVSLVFSVYVGALNALQEFVAINAVSVGAALLKNVFLIVFLMKGGGILSVAIIQLLTSLLRCFVQKYYMGKKYSNIYFDHQIIDKSVLKKVYNYSVYSFIIAIALKILFYTDSIVIGKMIGVEYVTYFAIPSSLLDYVEKYVWAMIAVLVPIISGNSVLDRGEHNKQIYIHATRCTIMLSAPVMITLFWLGPDFIRLWMGDEIASQSAGVLRILIVGYGVAFTQLPASALLKGIAKHRVLALIMMLEAIANIFTSVALAPTYGIRGVAIGTAVPLCIASIIVAIYTCHCLKMPILKYLQAGYIMPGLSAISVGLLSGVFMSPGDKYWEIFFQGALMVFLFTALTYIFMIDKNRKKCIVVGLKNIVSKLKSETV